MSDTDATQARHDVVADVDEILEHIINANMLSMPYDVYFELFDAVAGLGVEIENLQAENVKLREQSERLFDKTLELATENNKLRELCKLCEREAENAKLWESLERAAGIIADICGECPVSRYEWLSSDGCAEKCGTVTEEECWIAYLTGKRWDESGAEVDE